jgi:hypothetical protein
MNEGDTKPVRINLKSINLASVRDFKILNRNSMKKARGMVSTSEAEMVM